MKKENLILVGNGMAGVRTLADVDDGAAVAATAWASATGRGKRRDEPGTL